MLKCCVLDLETACNVGGKWGSDSKDPENDFYTIITGETPDRIRLWHSPTGCKRHLPASVTFQIQDANLIIGHNLAFDLGYIWHTWQWQEYLDEGKAIWDTQLAEYLLSGQRHQFASLAELQLIYLGKKTKESRISRLFQRGISGGDILQAKERCKRVFALYEKYCYDDGASTLLVFKQQYLKAKRLGMLSVIKMFQQALLAVIQMHKTGIHIDLINCERTLRDMRIQALDYLRQATEATAHLWDERLGAFNINSPKQKSAMLFGGTFIIKERVADGKYKNGNDKYKNVDKEVVIKGFGVDKRLTSSNKKGDSYVTDANVVNNIYKKCTNPEAKEYCRLQKLAMNYHKICSTYLEPFLNLSIDGILYPHYNTTATITGRLSSSGPNFQNCPSSGKMADAVSGQLIAPDGWLCVAADYSQLEPHVTAMLTGDENLTKDLLSGICLHCRALSWVDRLSEGKTYEEIYQLAKVEEHPDWVLKRKKAKGINFKRAYGGGAKSMAEAEGMPIEDVQAIFDAQAREYPRVTEYSDYLVEEIQRNQQLSLRTHYAKSDIGGRQFENGVELLPCFMRDNGAKVYRPGEYRHFGTFVSLTGRRYSFEEIGYLDKYNRIKRAYSTTETKNYWVQGGAADVVNMALIEVVKYVRLNRDTLQITRQIHDSFEFYVKNGMESLHIPILCNIMSDIPKLFKQHLNINVPFKFPVEFKTGINFSDMKVWHNKGV